MPSKALILPILCSVGLLRPEPTLGEAELHLTLKQLTPQKPKVGEPILFQVAVCNSGARDVPIQWDASYETPTGTFATNWKCKVWQGDVLVSEKPAAPVPPDSLLQDAVVPAKGEFCPFGKDDGKSLLNLFLPKDLQPGTYEVELTVSYTVGSEDNPDAEHVDLPVRFPLSLSPATKEEQRELYKSLLGKLKKGIRPQEFRCLQAGVKDLAKPEYTDLLLSALDDGTTPAVACIQALGRLSTATEPDVLKRLLRFSVGPNGPPAQWANIYLEMSAKSEHLPVLVECLKSEDHLCRLRVLRLLRKVGTREAARDIARCLGDQNHQVRTAAAGHLGGLRFPENLGDLEIALRKETEADVREALLRAITKITKSKRPPLESGPGDAD